MKINYKISEVARLFNIPVSTLHHWEKEGLVSVKHNDDNRYREYTLSDILDIWEVVLYRDLNISTKSIRGILERDMNNLKTTYDESISSIDKEIERLMSAREKILRQQSLISQVNELRQSEYNYEEPDMDICVRDVYSEESMKLTLADPSRCAIFLRDMDGSFERGISKPSSEGDEVLWEKRGNEKYISFLLEINKDDMRDNNIAKKLSVLKRDGINIEYIIGKYLIICTDRGKRYEYYKAFGKII